MEKEKIVKVLLIVSLAVLVVFLLWFMFGNSPTIEQLFVLFVLPLYVFVFGIYEKMNARINMLSSKIMETREQLQKDLGDMKQRLGRMEGRLKAR